MIDIPLSAKVECTDGACGESVTVIVDPVARKVTHFVVKDKTSSPAVERLVPVDRVVETTREVIRLNCAREDLAEMEPFVEMQYVRNETPPPDLSGVYYSVFMTPYVTSVEARYTPVEVESVPEGELALRRGTLVEATDGYVGKVGELMVDPASGQITHLVLQEGHLWRKKEISVPVSAIDRVFEETVYLNLDKQAVESLPSILVKRHYGILP